MTGTRLKCWRNTGSVFKKLLRGLGASAKQPCLPDLEGWRQERARGWGVAGKIKGTGRLRT